MSVGKTPSSGTVFATNSGAGGAGGGGGGGASASASSLCISNKERREKGETVGEKHGEVDANDLVLA